MVPKTIKKEAGSGAPSMAPANTYLFPCLCYAGQAFLLSLVGTLEGPGAEEVWTQVPGAQAVRLLAVYIGCFILHRVIHAKVGWAWADVPICTELNKVGL